MKLLLLCLLFGACLAQEVENTETEQQEKVLEETKTAEDMFDCSDKEPGNYALNENACANRFVSCTQAKEAVLFNCSTSNTFFDVEENACLLFEDVPACSGTPKPPKPTTEEVITAAPTQGEEVMFDCSNLPDSNYQAGDCENFFFQCSGSIVYKADCAEENLKYSVNEDACVAPSNAPGCPEFEPSLPCGDRPNGFYQDAEDCTKFIFCVDTFVFSLNCPEGQVYDNHVKRCKAPERTLPPCGDAQMPPPFSCKGKENKFFRNPSDCDTYYKCDEEEKEVFTCADGRSFDEDTQSCQVSSLVAGCMPPMDQDLIAFCRFEKKDGIFPFPGNCHRSVVCIQDVPFVFFCSQRNRPDFDPVSLSCVAEIEGCD